MYSQPIQETDSLLPSRHEKQSSLSVSDRHLSGDKQPLRSGADESGDAFDECCGLNSSNPQIKKSRRLKFCFGCFIFFAIFLPLLFLIIIPSVTQHMVNESTLNIIQANIINPNDESFTSHVTQKFQDIDSSVEGTIQMHKLSLMWDEDPETKGSSKLATLTHSSTIDITTSKVTLKSQANVKDIEALSAFNLFAISADKFQWKIKGTANVETMGLNIPVDIDKTVQMTGFQNFPIPPVINQINITGGTTTAITNEIKATFTNPANIAITFGQDVEFTLKSDNFIIGTGLIHNLDLQTGVFPLNAIASLTGTPGSPEYDQLMKVISNFTTGYDSPVTMGPFQATHTIQWLEAGLASMNLQTSIPGLTQHLIDSVDMYPVDGSTIIPFTMYMSNPIDTIYKLSHIKATITSSGIPISTIDTDVSISIPPRTTILSPRLNASVIMTPAAFGELDRLSKAGTGLLYVQSALTGAINEFPTQSTYSQVDVPATIHH